MPNDLTVGIADHGGSRGLQHRIQHDRSHDRSERLAGHIFLANQANNHEQGQINGQISKNQANSNKGAVGVLRGGPKRKQAQEDRGADQADDGLPVE